MIKLKSFTVGSTPENTIQSIANLYPNYNFQGAYNYLQINYPLYNLNEIAVAPMCASFFEDEALNFDEYINNFDFCFLIGNFFTPYNNNIGLNTFNSLYDNYAMYKYDNVIKFDQNYFWQELRRFSGLIICFNKV